MEFISGECCRSAQFARLSPKRRHTIWGVFSVFFATMLLCPPPCANADEYYRSLEYDTPRFTLHIQTSSDSGKGDPRIESIASEAIAALNENFDEYRRIFDQEIRNKVVLRFLTPKEFHRQTGAPEWTSAMYYRGEITVPIPVSGRVNLDQLKRALRHELLHFITAEMSRNRCPAWLDEGIAQLLEGQPNPLLGPALRTWLSQDNPMPLDWLEHGFTMLEDSVVPAAYAQSLFATRTLVNSYGFKKVTRYIRNLGQGMDNRAAFRDAFESSFESFERKLASQLQRWAMSSNRNP